MLVKKMRVLRLAHGISLAELAAAAGVSAQWLSEAELSPRPHTAGTQKLIQAAFEQVLLRRKQELARLEAQYRKHQDSLFELVEETKYEL